MITLDNYNFLNKTALVRVDFNVPLNGRSVGDDTRIKAAIPTIEKIINDGGSVILMSHLGRPKGKDDTLSLELVAEHLNTLIPQRVHFAKDCIGGYAKIAVDNLPKGEVLMLENLRFYNEETEGNEDFAEELASYADVYVNDAFGTAHRAHASTTIVAKHFPNNKVAGYLLSKEVESIEKVLSEGEKPILAIVGGAKVSSKLSILKNLVAKVDEIIIGGGMAFTFLKAMGYKVGKSLVENDLIDTAKDFLANASINNVKIHLPLDVVCNNAFENEGRICERDVNNIQDDEMGLDIGLKTCQQFKEVINRAKTILWNGPMGVFELSSFAEGTIYIAKSVSESGERGAFTVVGGGDSVTAINKFNLADKISHVSTGGGAMLEYIEGKTLPGIAALN